MYQVSYNPHDRNHYIMSKVLLQEIEKKYLKADMPHLKPGDTVKIYQSIKEGEKQRVQMYQGLVIKKSSGSGVGKTFTVRKVVGEIGVEKIFPLHSPTITKIEVMKHSRVRRAKLYYMRKRSGKEARMKEKQDRQLVVNKMDVKGEEVQVTEKDPAA